MFVVVLFVCLFVFVTGCVYMCFVFCVCVYGCGFFACCCFLFRLFFVLVFCLLWVVGVFLFCLLWVFFGAGFWVGFFGGLFFCNVGFMYCVCISCFLSVF